MENVLTLSPEMIETLIAYGIKIVAALALLIIGRWIAMGIRGLVRKVMTRHGVDVTIVGFTCNLVYIGLLAFVITAALGQLGIQTTSFIAILGAAGLAIGLALQGSLANFAAGFLIILFRPFKVGDFIEGAGIAGKVQEIQLFSTRLTTGDNKLIIVPNSSLTGDNIVNFSAMDTRRVDLTIGVGYDDDLKKVRGILEDILAKDGRILKDPAPMIAVSELADNSVNFVVRVWVDSADYWGVYFDTTETVKQRFDDEGVSIPYPQRDVHVYEHKAVA